MTWKERSRQRRVPVATAISAHASRDGSSRSQRGEPALLRNWAGSSAGRVPSGTARAALLNRAPVVVVVIATAVVVVVVVIVVMVV